MFTYEHAVPTQMQPLGGYSVSASLAPMLRRDSLLARRQQSGDLTQAAYEYQPGRLLAMYALMREGHLDEREYQQEMRINARGWRSTHDRAEPVTHESLSPEEISERLAASREASEDTQAQFEATLFDTANLLQEQRDRATPTQ